MAKIALCPICTGKVEIEEYGIDCLIQCTGCLWQTSWEGSLDEAIVEWGKRAEELSQKRQNITSNVRELRKLRKSLRYILFEIMDEFEDIYSCLFVQDIDLDVVRVQVLELINNTIERMGEN